jgi:hypothetical protein
MAKRPIDDVHHVLRWASHEKLEHSPDPPYEIIGFQISAFQVRPHLAEKCLSSAWVEHFPGERADQIRDAARHLGKQVKTTKAGGGAFAVGNVGQIKADGRRQSSIEIDVLLTGNHRNSPHAEVWGVTLEDKALQALLAASSWSELVKAIDVLDF